MAGLSAGLTALPVYVRHVISARVQSARIWVWLLSLLMLGGGRMACAQVTAGASPGLNAALVRLFGNVNAFTAQLHIRMTDGQGTETLSAPMKFSLLDGKMRGDLDVTKLKSTELPAFAASAAKSVGMQNVITLVRPDRKETYLLYPAFQACVVAPIDEADVAALKKPAKIQKTPLGRETLDGHRCVKNKVVVTESDGRQHEATVWNATDLKDFPLRIQTVDGAVTIILHFRQVKFERPAAKDFDLPAGTAKYDDPQALAQAVMKKLIGEALGVGK